MTTANNTIKFMRTSNKEVSKKYFEIYANNKEEDIEKLNGYIFFDQANHCIYLDGKCIANTIWTLKDANGEIKSFQFFEKGEKYEIKANLGINIDDIISSNSVNITFDNILDVVTHLIVEEDAIPEKMMLSDEDKVVLEYIKEKLGIMSISKDNTQGDNKTRFTITQGQQNIVNWQTYHKN